MTARAASAALAIVAGLLVTPLAAAEPPPPLAAPPPAESASTSSPAPPIEASPVVAPLVHAPPVYAPPGYAPPGYAPPGYAPPGYWPPGYAPPGYAPPGYGPPILYAPWPMVWRDGAWHAAGRSPEPPPSRPSRDPMFATGITVGVTGLLTTALGTALFVSASSARKACGLSSCIVLPDKEEQNDAAAVIAGGVGATLFGSALALAGPRGPAPARRSNARMVTGLIFTALGVSAAAGSVAQAAMSTGRDPLPGEVFPRGYSQSSAYYRAEPAALAISAGVCFAVGIPLWLTGASVRAPASKAPVAASALDLLPSAGGMALRWTR